MQVYLNYNNRKWKKYKIDFEKIANMTAGAKYKNAEVSIILTDDSEIHAINRQYRNIDRPTNVLSFELGDDVLLGDIYISLDTVAREAKQMGIPITAHAAHMVVHGVLHLLGYDHIDDNDAIVMEKKEIQILKKLGIKNPYDENVCKDASCCPGGKIISWFKGFSVRENSFWQYALYALFGGVASLGFAPFYMWYMTLFGIAGAYWLTVRNKNLGGFWHAFLRVFPFGAAYGLAMFWWVLNSIFVIPELTQQFAIWTLPGVIGLMLAGGFIFSWPFVVIRAIRTKPWGRAILFAATWVLVLWLREWLFTGFPWNPIANITLPFPKVANSMSLWGALGLSFAIVGFVASLVELLRNKRSLGCWMLILLWVVLGCLGVRAGAKNIYLAAQGAGDSQVMIRIVQPGQAQSQKATHSRAQALANAQENLQRLVTLAVGAQPDLIVFPETTYPFAIVANDEMPLAKFLGRPVIIGANSVDSSGVYNSMIVASSSGQIDKIYSKSHLVPFGEYRPLGFLPSPIDLVPGQGAELISVATRSGEFVFAPAVCYEIIFSDSLIPRGAGLSPNAIINITNDNWFGRTPGTYQHLDMVRRYAIESGMPIVRANYSGISAFVSSDGAVVSALPIGASGSLDGFVWGAHDTPYRTIGMNWWMIIILGFACAMLIFARDRNDK